VEDVTLPHKRGSFCLVHSTGFDSDVFMEMALTFALNGFVVHLVDLEGFGHSAGQRVNRISIEKFQTQVGALVLEASPSLPCFLLGHGVGALAIN
jgi:alpha-beta hydrolase superfamily lysophospholipase